MATDAEAVDAMRRWPLYVGYGLLIATWFVWLGRDAYASRLFVQFGPAEDVVDSLGRAAFIAKRTNWLWWVMIACDGIAEVAFFATKTAGWRQAVRILGVLLAAGVLLLHGFLACVGSIIAG